MPQRSLSILLNDLRQGNGTLSMRATTTEFAALSDDEVRDIESKYQQVFMAD